MDIVMRKDPAELAGIIKRVVEGVKATVEELKGIKGVAGVFAAAPMVVCHVQVLAEELKLVNEDKKAIAVRAVLDLVPDRWVPDALIEPFVGWAVERALERLKKDGWAILEKVKAAIKAKIGGK